MFFKKRKTPDSLEDWIKEQVDKFSEQYEKDHKEEIAEEKRRKSIPLYFKEPITAEKFHKLAVQAGKTIDRLWIETEDHYVYGTVKSSSGISEWHFELDYNDYGRITGQCYTVRLDNYDSNIPNVFIEKFGSLIQEQLKGHYCSKCGSNLNEQRGYNPDNNYYFCRKCGAMIVNPKVYSGEKFPGIYWLCDECDDLLNAQPGFRDIFSKWKCQKCGHITRIDSDSIHHEISMKFSKVRLSWVNGDSNTKVKDEIVNCRVFKSVTWEEIEQRLDYLFQHFDEINYEGEHRAQNNRPGDTVVIDDLMIELKPDDSEFPSIGFAPYQGCYFEKENVWRVLKREYLVPNCIKQIFKNFYDTQDLINREWWD